MILIFFHLGSRMPDPTKPKEETENFFVLPLFHKLKIHLFLKKALKNMSQLKKKLIIFKF